MSVAHLMFLEEGRVRKHIPEMLEACDDLALGVLTPPQEAAHRVDHLLTAAHRLQLCHSLLAGHLGVGGGETLLKVASTCCLILP